MKNLHLFLLLTLLFSCNNKQPVDNPIIHTYINDSIKGLCFKAGSYWIYKCDSLAGIDCTYVARIDSGFSDVYWYKGGFIEYYNIIFGVISPNGVDSMFTYISLTHFLINDPYLTNTHAGGYLPPVLFSVDTINDWSYCGSKNVGVSFIKIGQNIFSNVQQCRFSFHSKNDSSTFFTNSKIGILKKMIVINSKIQEWSLIRWKIFK